MASLGAILASGSASSGAPSVRVTDLKCEYAVNPLGIDRPAPRLSWVLESSQRGQRQSAYQVLVAESEESLRANKGDLWDSGKVLSSQSVHVEYQGPPLRSGQRCYWQVRVWDRDGRPSAWSKRAWWEMGLLEPDEWHGKWIGRTEETAAAPAPLLRKAFHLDGKVKRARAYVSGLGYYELRLNGKKVGDRRLDPGYTRYDRRVLYATYDVTSLLRKGDNALGALLGCGWYNVHTRAVWYFDRAPWRAAPRMILELRVEYEDGRTQRVVTDDSWRTSTGPILFDSIYGGETYDARLEKPGWDSPEYDDSGWEPARVVEAPGGRLTAQFHPPIRVTDTLEAVRVTVPKPGVYLFDLGQNFAGHARLTVSGPAGTKVVMRYGERLKEDGTLDQSHIAQFVKNTDPAQQFQTDTYILKGKGREVWESRFVYHGFQYVEVTGYPGKPSKEAVKGQVVHSDVAPVGQFSCSNPLLNRIWQNSLWSYVSNLHGIPTDCPHREKNGWTGDAHLAAEMGLLHFDSHNVYAKWLNDLHDEQRPTGELPGIVPSSGWGYEWGNGPAWDSAFVLIPWYLYLYRGDTGVLADHYDRMKLYVDYLTGKAKDGIVSLGLGDWVAPGPTAPVELTSTGYYYADALIVSKAAAILGKSEDARKYADLAESIRKAFNARFLDPATGRYADGGQTAQSCALYQGLVDPEREEAVLSRLLAAIEEHDGHIFTGILGAKYVLNTLTDHDRADVAYRIATQTTQPGWGHWIERGATTLWEDWAGGASLNHIMYGDISAWFIKTLAGINPDHDAPGFARFTVKPHVVGDLKHARAEYQSIRGLITSEWRLDGGRFRLEVTVPANSTAAVHVPAERAEDVREGDRPAGEAEGVRYLRGEGGRAVYEVGSGTYRFTAPAPRAAGS